MDDYDIIIPVYQRTGIESQIYRIKKLNRPPSNIIVVDGGSNLPETIKELINITKKSLAKILIHPEKPNRSKLINAGAKSIKSPYILISDCDIEWTDEAIGKMLEQAKTGAVCHTELVIDSEKNEEADILYRIGYKIHRRNKNKSVFDFEIHPVLANKKMREGPGLVLISSDSFFRTGGLLEDLFGWGWEDQDFLIRCTLANLKIKKAGKVWHCTNYKEEYRNWGLNLPTKISRLNNLIKSATRMSKGNFRGSVDHPLNNGTAFPCDLKFNFDLMHSAQALAPYFSEWHSLSMQLRDRTS
jgi:glycosyltransferase involved in cell wall biosynthesis